MAFGGAPSARFGASRELVEEATFDLAAYVRNGVASRQAGFFQKRGEAAMPLSGSRGGPAHGRVWVGRRIAAYRSKESEAGIWLNHLSRLAHCLRNHGLVFKVPQP